MRLIYILSCAIGGALGSYFGQPFIRGNADAVNEMITVFTVFAGFLVAVITFIGDPTSLPAGSWRSAESKRQAIEAGLIRNMWLFSIYLITIGLIFISLLLNKSASVSESVKDVFEWLYLFLGIFAFLLSLALPKTLNDLQKQRVDAEIDRRRKDAKIDD